MPFVWELFTVILCSDSPPRIQSHELHTMSTIRQLLDNSIAQRCMCLKRNFNYRKRSADPQLAQHSRELATAGSSLITSPARVCNSAPLILFEEKSQLVPGVYYYIILISWNTNYPALVVTIDTHRAHVFPCYLAFLLVLSRKRGRRQYLCFSYLSSFPR